MLLDVANGDGVDDSLGVAVVLRDIDSDGVRVSVSEPDDDSDGVRVSVAVAVSLEVRAWDGEGVAEPVGLTELLGVDTCEAVCDWDGVAEPLLDWLCEAEAVGLGLPVELGVEVAESELD